MKISLMEVTDLKFKKSKMLLGTMCALVLATTIGAFPSKAESAFDYNYYFWKYPDVANAVGFDPRHCSIITRPVEWQKDVMQISRQSGVPLPDTLIPLKSAKHS